MSEGILGKRTLKIYANAENLFVHRLHKGAPPDSKQRSMRSKTPNTFWRSPYTGDLTGSGNRTLCMRPIITVTSPKCGPMKQMTAESVIPMKSILKNKSPSDFEDDAYKNDPRPRPTSESPNLITTGTGKGVPHGSTVRPKTTGKRVQFNSLPKHSTLDASRYPIYPSVSPGIHFKGRRLYLDKNMSTRMLGSPTRSMTTWQNRNGNQTEPVSLTLSGGEANIKSQISAFIRKLRLAESERVSSIKTISIPDETSQSKTADKLRKSRSCPVVPIRPDWSDFDMDKIADSEPQIQAIDSKENLSKNEFDSDSDSGSISIESFESLKEAKVVEKTPSGAKIFRPRPNASLYTKYRHITSNEVNKYGNIGSAGSMGCKFRLPNRGNNSVNFCDSKKTNQILGWLEEVRTAQAQDVPSVHDDK